MSEQAHTLEAPLCHPSLYEWDLGDGQGAGFSPYPPPQQDALEKPSARGLILIVTLPLATISAGLGGSCLVLKKKSLPSAFYGDFIPSSLPSLGCSAVCWGALISKLSPRAAVRGVYPKVHGESGAGRPASCMESELKRDWQKQRSPSFWYDTITFHLPPPQLEP